MYEKKCKTVYKKVCEDLYKTVYEPYTETECITEYKEDCEYHWQGDGYDKVWVIRNGSSSLAPVRPTPTTSAGM